MIWIWLLTRHSHKWGTGLLDRYFAFVCAHCGVTTASMVRTFGYGAGPNQLAAERSAAAAADAFAYRAVSASACPHCGELQPAVHEQFARASKKSDQKRRFRVPVAVAALVLALVVLAIPAIGDLAHSFTLSFFAVSASATIGALVLASMSGPVVTPATDPSGVWFSMDPHSGPGSWFPARAGRTPFVPQPPSLLRKLSFAAAGITTLSAIVALVLWGRTFRTIYVVSSEAPFHPITVSIDGVQVGTLTPPASTDAPFGTYEVRTSSMHRVVISGDDQAAETYDIDPKTAKHGWVVAPRSRQHGLCVTTLKWYYGKAPPKEADDDHVLNQHGELIPLKKSFDYLFTQPPSTIQTQNGASETRTTLRALDCASLAKEKIVPFRDAPAPKAPVDEEP
jgi:hypothetical protein